MKCYFCGHEMVKVDEINTLEEMEEYELEAETIVFYCPHCNANTAVSKPEQNDEDYIN